MAIIASHDWLESIRTALDSVQSSDQAQVAANLAMQHCQDAADALAGSWSSAQSQATVDIYNYSAEIAAKAAPFVGSSGHAVTGSAEWAALRSAIFTAYGYIQVVDGQFADQDTGMWSAAIVPMAEDIGQAIVNAPAVIVQAAGKAGSVVGQTAATAAAGILKPFKWWIAAAVGVLLLGALVYFRSAAHAR